MEVDEIQRQVCKFQRVSSNGSTTTTDNSSNPSKIAIHEANLELRNRVVVDDGGGGLDVVVGGGGGGGGGGGVARLCGWPSSRIVRVSRASGGKDRHSKVLTSKGLRDRRVRLSVSTAIQFYDLQDRLGYDQPSKAVEWLLKAASTSIDELPSLDPSFSGVISHSHRHSHQQQASEEKKSTENSTDFEDPSYRQQNSNNNKDNNNNVSKSPACSSTSETSKGSGLSLSRSENRVKARERAREMASKKDKDKETDSSARVSVLNQVSNISENSSFTDLLTGGMNSTSVRRPNPTASPVSRAHWTTPMDYFFSRSPQTPSHLIQMPQFNLTAGDNHHHNHQQQHHFSFLQDSFVPAVTTAGGSSGGGGESYNLNFSMTSSSSSGGALAPGFSSRGTLQSNLPSSLLPHHHHQHHIQRFQSSSSIDGSTHTNLPFFMASDHFPTTGGYDSQGLHLSYGAGGGDAVGRNSDHQAKKPKN